VRAARAARPPAAPAIPASEAYVEPESGERHLRSIRQLTFGGNNAEAYNPMRQSGYSSFRQARGSAGWTFGVRSSRKLEYGATNGSGADTVYVW
jgi:hypothetical protein